MRLFGIAPGKQEPSVAGMVAMHALILRGASIKDAWAEVRGANL